MICGLALLPIQNPGYAYMHQTMCNMHTRYRLLHLCIVMRTFTSGCLQHCKEAKYTLQCFQSKISLVWKYGMEYGRKFEHGMEYGRKF